MPLLATRLADAGVKVRAMMRLGGFAALAANFGIEGWSSLRFDALAALLADLPIKVRAVFLTNRLAAVLGLLAARFWASFPNGHSCIPFSLQNEQTLSASIAHTAGHAGTSITCANGQHLLYTLSPEMGRAALTACDVLYCWNTAYLLIILERLPDCGAPSFPCPERSKGRYPLNERMNTHAQRHRKPATASLVSPHAPHQRAANPFPQHSATITQYQHPLIQRIHRLRRREARDQTGLYYAEGLRFVIQAIQHHAAIEALVICRPLLTNALAQRLVRQQRQLGVPVLDVTPHVMHQLAFVEDPQGIGAVVRQHWEALAGLTLRSELCWIALQTVRSVGNLGTILRTSDAVGGAGVILLGNDIDPYDPAAVRPTMGALYSQRLVRTTVAEFVRWKHQQRCMLVGTSPGAPTDYRALAYRPPTILLMGEERKGLTPELQALCDHLVRIPMVGESDSLNLGVATGVMLYELFNQHRSPY